MSLLGTTALCPVTHLQPPLTSAVRAPSPVPLSQQHLRLFPPLGHRSPDKLGTVPRGVGEDTGRILDRGPGVGEG